MNYFPRTIRNDSGFTLIEVLIAIVIFSFAMLGLAGLQLNSVKYNQSSGFRSIAAQRAYEIADRMRANRQAYDNGDYFTQLATTTPPDPANPPCSQEVPGGGTQTITTGCTSAQVAQDDAFQWQTLNSRLLPSGQGVVCRDTTPNDGTPSAPACDGAGNRIVIKVWWNDSRGRGDAAPVTPTCVPDSASTANSSQCIVTVFQP